MFLAYNAAVSIPQVENGNAYILANGKMKSSSEVATGCAGGAGSPNPVPSGLRIFQEKLEICQQRANFILSVGLLLIAWLTQTQPTPHFHTDPSDL